MFGINKDLKIHFIGIGGIGMSGIAEVLLSLGYPVSGSDLNESENVLKLREHGAEIFIGHDESNIQDVQIAVYSSAINEKNPEVIKIKRLGIPIIKRAEMLAELMRLKFGIAVAGSHGKTTTTSFLSTILYNLEYSPTFIIGGVVSNLGGQAKMGNSNLLVAEADESDGSFLFLSPIMSVITNIDNDHLDHYGNIENIKSAFEEFANKVPFYGHVAINANDKNSVELIEKIRRPVITFGILNEETFGQELDYSASNLVYSEEGCHFEVETIGEKANVKITLAGKHNVLNSLGAIVTAHKLGATLKEAAKAAAGFHGVGRRFEKLFDSEFVIVDDYAHHPTEILATIETAKAKYKDKKIKIIFEPHRYTRTKEFWSEFVDCFSEIDEAFIAPIYAASEEAIPYIDSEVLVKNINEKFSNAKFLSEWDKAQDVFEENKGTSTVLLCLGAGAISKQMRAQVEKWKS